MPRTDLSAADGAPWLSLDRALGLIDKTFGIERMLADRGKDVLAPYYKQSRIGYDRVHSELGCMHAAINPEGVYDPAGFLVQPRCVADQVAEVGAARVLELGCGMGYNSLRLAAQLPGVDFTGLDLMESHIQAAEGRRGALGNLSFMQGSYDSVPEGLGPFDLVFAIETLCYAPDVDRVCAQIARVLRPGGRFVMFDGFRNGDLADWPQDMQRATLLYEIGVAVNRGFFGVGVWEAALQRAGLRLLVEEDLTGAVVPGLKVLQTKALKYLDDWKRRLAVKAMPKYLARNAAPALLGPICCAGPNGDTQPNGHTIAYRKIIAEKG